MLNVYNSSICLRAGISKDMQAKGSWWGLISSVSHDTLSCLSSWSNSLAAVVTGGIRPSGSKIDDV